LQEKVYSPLAPSLRQATEEEYLNFRNPSKENEKDLEERANELLDGDDKSNEIMEERIKDADLKIKAIDAIKTELPEENITKEDLDNAIEKVSQDINDDGIMDFIKSLFKYNIAGEEEYKVDESQTIPVEEEKNETVKEKEALKLQKTTEETEKALLEQKLADLTATWEKTKQPRKKEKIYKEIQELRKQIDKL